MVRYYMKCGHVAEIPSYPRGCARRARCSRCGCEEIEFKINTVFDKLDSRLAKCGTKMVKSRWDLPGFVWRPEEEYDLYFYGRDFRVINKGRVKIVKEKKE